MLQKIYISNKLCSLELSIHQRIMKEIITIFTKILSSTTVYYIYDSNVS